jgi:hypothetical protein
MQSLFITRISTFFHGWDIAGRAYLTEYMELGSLSHAYISIRKAAYLSTIFKLLFSLVGVEKEEE